jgi:hypothetical protein
MKRRASSAGSFRSVIHHSVPDAARSFSPRSDSAFLAVFSQRITLDILDSPCFLSTIIAKQHAHPLTIRRIGGIGRGGGGGN